MLCQKDCLWESGLGGLVGRLGRTTRNPWADYEYGFVTRNVMLSIFKAHQKSRR